MPDALTDIESLDAALKGGWTILTPNHRTSVQVHERYGAHLKSQSQFKVRSSPSIFPIDIWIKNIFQTLIFNEESLQLNTVLESYQELTLWKKIIRESDFSNPLLNLENSAAKVLEAYRLLIQWQISFKSLEVYQSKVGNSIYIDDCTAFLQWAKQYQRYCRKEKLISFSELLKNILPYIETNTFILPEKIILLGFNEPPPLYQSLFSILEKKIEIKQQQWQTMSPTVQKQSFIDSTAEVKAAAKWSKEILESNSEAKIGIISNELSSQHALFQRVFNATFTQKKEASTTFLIGSAINLTKNHPIFMEIPALLKLNQEELPSLELCHILRSPLLLNQEEENARAALEQYLRKNRQASIRSAHLRDLLNHDERAWHSPLLAQALQKCENLRRQQKFQQNIQAWADFFSSQLDILAWPDDEAQQQQQFLISCWHQVLENFKKLDFLYEAITFKQAHSVLTQLINSFSHSNNQQETPIQLFSPHDARGLRFTHLWFMGLSDLQWPASRYPNPFIPVPLQRKVQLPESSPELVHDTAKKLLFEIHSNTSDQLVLSFPRTNTNGELLPTPLISSLNNKTSFVNNSNDEISLHLHPSSLESYLDAVQAETTESLEETAYLNIVDTEILKGGIGLISNQAECPFRAFAIHRLKAMELQEFSYGIPAIDLGSAIHLILEQLWGELKTQDSISNLPSEKLDLIIHAACETGLEYLRKKHNHILQPAYAELEKKRLIKLMRKWLEQESLRSAFEVMEQEFNVQWKYADLTLDFKIDRIDKIKNGFALVDYKSGSSKLKISTDTRPSEPQLLLYADALAQKNIFKPINALLYAQVNIASLSYQGISLSNETYPKTGLSEQKQFAEYSSWEELRQHWKNALNNIAQEFLDGFIAITPKGSSSCQYCHLSAFCRIQEKNLMQQNVSRDQHE
ncbi:PD-(D/E)XK nuclease family protein [Haliea sp. AH-315-K21]|nr:PD-(D/E)XK nuclease family protein [Haliea sp. AH-315-K21]MBN4075164.1 PD-(D/E)XK nuclease family protein [Gammaproteobacteria bacterium AH-315-E17]